MVVAASVINSTLLSQCLEQEQNVLFYYGKYDATGQSSRRSKHFVWAVFLNDESIICYYQTHFSAGLQKHNCYCGNFQCGSCLFALNGTCFGLSVPLLSSSFYIQTWFALYHRTTTKKNLQTMKYLCFAKSQPQSTLYLKL